jgi:hypothetical protein
VSRRHDQQLAAFAALGTALGNAIPAAVTMRHEVTHRVEHVRRPQLARVCAEVYNNEGQLWRITPIPIKPDADYVKLPDFPVAWLTGNTEDVIARGQAGIALRFEYRPEP